VTGQATAGLDLISNNSENEELEQNGKNDIKTTFTISISELLNTIRGDLSCEIHVTGNGKQELDKECMC
jgi:hypothetical protein